MYPPRLDAAVIGRPMTLTAEPTLDLKIESRVRALSHGEAETSKKFFAENGYVVIKGVVPREKLALLANRMQAEFERQLHTGQLFNGGGLVSGHLNASPGEEGRFAYQALHESGVIDLIRSLSPRSTREPYVGCNFNLPGSVAQHYHMDRTFTNEFMIANVAVVDTNLVNGAIDLVPGTHKRFYKYWQWALERPYVNNLRLSMHQGDVLVRVSNLWHRGMPNRSAVPRPMLAFTWEDGGSSHADPFAIEDGKISFRPNWFRPSRLGRLRERIYASAPITYSAYRFVDSIINPSKLY
jgi:ectoine hydroxylase-related dioxygenase (phytanoyl-CoA dioxygenase family)